MSNRPNPRPTQSTSRRVSEARGASNSATPWIIGGGVVVVVMLALVAALVITRDTESSVAADGTDPAEQVDVVATAEPVSVTGEALPLFPADGDDPAVGMPMPVLSGDDLQGKPISIESTGNPEMLVYLAHWCPHCQREVPQLVSWMNEGGNGDVDVRGIATGIDANKPNYPPTAWLATENWTAATLLDPSGLAAEASGLSGFPFFVFLDASGNVTSRASGELSVEQIEQHIDLAREGAGTSPADASDRGPSSPAT